MNDSITQTIARHSAVHPSKLCMTDGENDLSYEQVWRAVYGFALELRKQGLGESDCAVVECTQNVEFLICCLSIQLIHAIFVPVEKNASPSRTLEIINGTEAKLYIGREKADAATAFMPVSSALRYSFRHEIDIDSVDFPRREETSEILFSTGTTGKSKGIELTHGNDIALAENVMYGVNMKPGNVELIPLPLSHSHGLRRCFGNFLNGSSVVICNGVILIKKFFDLIRQYNVTALDLTPSVLSIIFRLSKDDLGSFADQLDYIQLGSAPLIESDKKRLKELLPHTRLYNFYGTTESGCSCILDFNSSDDKPGCIGRPAKNASFIFVDENRKPLETSADDPGFIASHGSMNMKGYWRSPELTSRTMSGGYIYTHDLGYSDGSGLIYYIGREDDIINCGGIKISPEEIESVIIKHPLISDCACIPVPDKLKGHAPKLYLVVKKGEEFDEEKFRAFLSENLDANKIPRVIERINEIPRTYNGKIQRKKLSGNYC